MKIYFYDELEKKNVDQLLDLLSTYKKLLDEILFLMKNDREMKDFYVENNVYFYLLNITKIKIVLKEKTNKIEV